MQDAIAKLDELMRRLVEADQTGKGVEPLRLAAELDAIRAGLVRGRSVVPRAAGGERHYRCEACGTITHGQAAPASCPTCGKTVFYEADLEAPAVDAGPG